MALAKKDRWMVFNLLMVEFNENKMKFMFFIFVGAWIGLAIGLVIGYLLGKTI